MSKALEKLSNHPRFQSCRAQIFKIIVLAKENCESRNKALESFAVEKRAGVISLVNKICKEAGEFENFEGSKKAKSKLIQSIKLKLDSFSEEAKEPGEETENKGIEMKMDSETPLEFRYDNASINPQTIELYKGDKNVGMIFLRNISGADWRMLRRKLEKNPSERLLDFLNQIGNIKFNRKKTDRWCREQREMSIRYYGRVVSSIDRKGIFSLEVFPEKLK